MPVSPSLHALVFTGSKWGQRPLLLHTTNATPTGTSLSGPGATEHSTPVSDEPRFQKRTVELAGGLRCRSCVCRPQTSNQERLMPPLLELAWPFVQRTREPVPTQGARVSRRKLLEINFL
jgi:hypothetical protein